MRTSLLSLVGLAILVSACGSTPPPQPPPAPPTPAATTPSAPAPAAAAPKAHDAVDRATFNRVAARLNLPLYWTADANKNGTIEPNETAALLFYPGSGSAKWVNAETGAFTPSFEEAYA